MRYLFALFLLAHCMVHALWFVPPPATKDGRPWPFTLSTSPTLSPFRVPESVLRPLGTVLVVIVMVAYAVSALGAAGVPGLVMPWPTITLFASGLSIVVTILFWNRQFHLALLIDAALIVTIWGNWWPATLVY